MISRRIFSLCARACLLGAFAAAVIAAVPARAADPVFPIGSRIGMVPPAGMSLSPAFQGFEDSTDKAAILLATFPGDAFAALDKSMVPGSLQAQGVDKREPFQAAAGNGFLLTGERQQGDQAVRVWMLVAPAGNVTALVTVKTPAQDTKYTDQVVRAALATVAVRPSIPDAERMSMLPFTVGDFDGFQIEDVLPGRALMLVHLAAAKRDTNKQQQADKTAAAPQSDKAANDNKDIEGHAIDARLLIAALPGGPTEAKDDDQFARVTFNQIGGIREVRIQDAEPLRINGQSGYETLAKAKAAQDDTDLMVVQWLRFGSGGYMQMIGTAKADVWSDVFMRMRAVRDSIDNK